MRAERRPARDDFTPRWMRATVPAHSKPECKGTGFLGFDALIEQRLPGKIVEGPERGRSHSIHDWRRGRPKPPQLPGILLTPVTRRSPVTQRRRRSSVARSGHQIKLSPDAGVVREYSPTIGNRLARIE